MPDKSDKAGAKKKYHSLSAHVFRIILFGSFIVGTLMLIAGLATFVYTSGYRTIANAMDLTKKSRDTIVNEIDPTVYGREVLKIYKSLSDEERAGVGTKEYYEKFRKVTQDKGYKRLKYLLSDYLETGLVDDIYYGVYDEETCSLIYIADPAKGDDACHAGHAEKVPAREVRKFISLETDSDIAYDLGNTKEYGIMATSGVRVTGKDKKQVGFILADNNLNTFITQIKWLLINYTLTMVLLIAILGTYLMHHMRKSVVDPINSIAEAAKSYASDKKAHRESKDHFSSLGIKTGDEIENLSLAMVDMEKDLNDYEKNLAKVTSEKEKIAVELDLAEKIQRDTLPSIFPPFPDRTDFDIYASMDPAKEVGGDFYDFFLIDDTHVAFEIADVSGKGIPAALFMMVVKSMLQNDVMEGMSPAAALTNINDRICQNEHEGMFVTVWLGVLDLKSGELKAANAGHEYPAIRHAGGEYEIYRDRHSFVIGGMEGIQYKEYELTLEPGSKIFLYTDGVTEAIDKNNEMFGLDRMIEALNTVKDGDVTETLEEVKVSVDDFVGGEEQFDDMTMLCFDYKGGEAQKNEIDKELLVDVTLPAEIENQAIVTDRIDEELDRLDCPPKQLAQINIAIDELFSNIAKYAYAPGKGDATVRMELEREPAKAVSITFIDSGTPYDPIAEKDPDITLSAEERGIGGLGILMVKKSMDDLKYEYKDGKNIFMIKRVIE